MSLRGETPFPEGGDGVVLKFLNSDCDSIQNVFGETWLTGAYERIAKVDVKFIFACLRAGAKKNGKKFALDIDSLDVPIGMLAGKVLDALFISVHGRSFDEHVEKMRKEMEEAEKTGASPLESLSSPENSSPN